MLVGCLSACGCVSSAEPGPRDQTTAGDETATVQKALVAKPATVPGAAQLVSSGTVASSAHYQMAFTLGQPTQNQDSSRSPSHHMKGGLIGANRRLK